MKKDYLAKLLKIYYYLPQQALWRAIEAQILCEIDFKEPMLDAGCGDGIFARILFENDHRIAEGCDLSPTEIRKAKKQGIYNNLSVADIRSLPYKNETFATILSNCTLEHIPQEKIAIKELYRVLKPGGKLIFTVPSEKFLENLYYPNFYKQKGDFEKAKEYKDYVDKRLSHFYYHSPKEWEALLLNLGFRNVQIKYYMSPEFAAYWDRLQAFFTKKIGLKQFEAYQLLQGFLLIGMGFLPYFFIRLSLAKSLYRYYENEKLGTDVGIALLVIANK